MEIFNPPSSMSFTTGNVSEIWKIWHQKFENFMIATEKCEKPDKTKIAILLSLLGDEGVSVYNTFKFSGETSKEKYDDVINKFTEYCVPRRNVVVERYKFFSCNQQEGQSVDSYLTLLKTLAATCEFVDQEESLIRDRIVLGIRDTSLQERLLREPTLTLKKATEFIRAFEVSKEQLKTISDNNPKTAVDVVKAKRLPKKDFAASSARSISKTHGSYSDAFDCRKCGRTHKKRECPAFNRLCNICKQRNHFAKMCKSNSEQKFSEVNRKITGPRHVNEVTGATNHIDISSLYIDSVSTGSENSWYKNVLINNEIICFKLDTGAEANILPLSIFKGKKLYELYKLSKTEIMLISYSNHKLKPEGSVNLLCSTDKCKNVLLEFIIVNCDSKPILGLHACKMLNLIQRVDQIGILNKDEIVNKYNDVFQGLGKFPGQPYHIEVNENVTPVINPPRRVPQSILTNLKDTLCELEIKGVIEQVNKPTDWVSSLVTVEKPNGKLRVCSRNLNKAIKWEHHMIPSSDEIIGQLEGKKFFSVLDLKEGFWQIPLDEPSSDLCTFNSPFGRYKFKRLPFGISSAPEVFQKQNQKLFGDIRGVQIYFDDLIIAGNDKEEHDSILLQVLERAKSHNIKFNSEKFQFRVDEAKYMGLIISEKGVKPDESHVRAINELVKPTNKKDIRRLLGMVNFLSKFIPNVSKVTAPLRELLKNNVEFQWSFEQEKAFNSIKNLISTAPVLRVFNSTKQIVIQCDSSKDGLGVCFLQEGHPVSFASRSLTECEKNYAQIEKELLAIVFACEKYHNFIYGHKVIIQSDHKPLTSIIQKPIGKITTRLQKMILKLLKYDLTIQYLPGKDMFLADTLSRAFIKDKVLDDPEMLHTVHTISKNLPMSERRIQQFKIALQNDEELKVVMNYCKEGWPDKNKIPGNLKKFYKLHNELYLIDELLFLNNKIVVPKSLRAEMLVLIHEAHMGIEKCKSRAREIMYWPGLSKDIEEVVGKCEICAKFRKAQPNEPLQPHEIPDRAFQKIGIDIMFFKNVNYLVVIDYFSKWIEVERVNNKSVGEIIKVLEMTMARFGVPETIVSDNSPFNCWEFKKFSKEWDITLLFISPYHSQSNGMVEKGVGIVKALFKKALEDGKRPFVSLLEYRNTPISGIGLSPAQMLFNRRLRTKLPISNKLLNAEIFKTVSRDLEKRQIKQKFYFDKTTRALRPLETGENVMVRNFKNKTWEPATIIAREKNPRSYKIKTMKNKIYIRNRKYLIPSKGNWNVSCESNLDCDFDNAEQDNSVINVQPSYSNVQNNSNLNVNNSNNRQSILTRSGRISKRPAYLNDYELK